MAFASLTAAIRATRLGFFCAGFATACWAPLIPFAKTAVGANEAQLGVLLLCLGIGSVAAMLVTGWMTAKFGARPMMILGGIGLALFLPTLLMTPSFVVLGLCLAVFGAALGTLDVSVNVHAIEVEGRAKRTMMSGFHAIFSLGGVAGAAFVTLLLRAGQSAFVCALMGAVILMAAILAAIPGMIRSERAEAMPLVLPRGIVVLLAVLAGITFLAEGAVLDWSALLILEGNLLSVENGGLGYMVFSITMTIGRLTGDALVARVGGLRVLIVGGLVCISGFACVLVASGPVLALAGFALIGAGAANLVPILFSAAGRQTVMPVGLAVAAVTTTGYAGVLLGPAAIGFVAEATSLRIAFWGVAALVIAVPLSARRVMRV